MRKLLVNTFMTLDGVMQAPGGPEEDTDGGFAFGGWSFPLWDDAMSKVMADLTAEPFDLLLGRRTYDIFSGFWPQHPEEEGAKELNDATKYVASRGAASLDWGPAVAIEGDAATGVAEVKRGDGPRLLVYGSANLIQSLLPANVIDEFHLWVFPVVLGSGKRLFGDGTIPEGLRLVDSTVSGTGVFIGTYEPAGEVATGSF